MDARELTTRLNGKWRGSYGSAPCPAHEDRHPSLSIKDASDGRLLVHCHTGCEQAHVIEALKARGYWPDGELWPELVPPSSSSARSNGHDDEDDPFANVVPIATKQKRSIVATYPYRDESGTVLFEAVRYEPKDFRQRYQTESGYVWNLEGIRRVVYRLPELIAAPLEATVYIVEGEKDCDRLAELGLIATCNPMGAGKWAAVDVEPFRGRPVAILPDNDPVGHKHAIDVAASLRGVAASVRIINLPGLPDKGDVSDWLDAGGTPESLQALVDASEADAGPYPLQTLAELIRTATIEQKELVQGLLWTGKVHWIFSAPGVGKTLWNIAIGMHIADGRPFHGRAVQQGPVMLIEEDSPLSGVAEYVEMLADIYEFDLETLPFWITREQGLRVMEHADTDRLIEAIERCPQKPINIIIDACERITPSDRFATKELDPLARSIQWMTNRNITVSVLDHTRKAGNPTPRRKDEEVEPTNPMELLYGARAKSAISDVMWYLSGNTNHGVRQTCQKFRGEFPPPIDFRFDSDSGYEVRTVARTRAQTPTEQAIMKFVNNNRPGYLWHTTAEIIAGCGRNPRSAERAIASLVKAGWLEKDGETRNVKLRAVTNVPGLFDR